MPALPFIDPTAVRYPSPFKGGATNSGRINKPTPEEKCLLVDAILICNPNA
jgi:hypothetical protein